MTRVFLFVEFEQPVEWALAAIFQIYFGGRSPP